MTLNWLLEFVIYIISGNPQKRQRISFLINPSLASHHFGFQKILLKHAKGHMSQLQKFRDLHQSSNHSNIIYFIIVDFCQVQFNHVTIKWRNMFAPVMQLGNPYYVNMITFFQPVIRQSSKQYEDNRFPFCFLPHSHTNSND